jgi:hypothetical protein
MSKSKIDRHTRGPAPDGNGFSVKLAGLLAEWQAQLGVHETLSDRIAAKLKAVPKNKREAILHKEMRDRAKISDAMEKIEKKIASIPAQTIADTRLKLWIHSYFMANNYAVVLSDATAYAPEGEGDKCLLLSALRDVERLAGAAA